MYYQNDEPIVAKDCPHVRGLDRLQAHFSDTFCCWMIRSTVTPCSKVPSSIPMYSINLHAAYQLESLKAAGSRLKASPHNRCIDASILAISSGEFFGRSRSFPNLSMRISCESHLNHHLHPKVAEMNENCNMMQHE